MISIQRYKRILSNGWHTLVKVLVSWMRSTSFLVWCDNKSWNT
nr:MAG TPA: hypothetical protein [Caudoviricetes sp.]